MRINTRGLAGWIAGLWGGAILSIGLIAAPSGFAIASREVAGRIAGRMLAQEAWLSVVVAMVMLGLLWCSPRSAAPRPRGDVVLTVCALLCTLLGFFAIQPLMAEARAGQGLLSFGALHGISVVLFVLKGGLVSALAWRLTSR